jgi:phosphotransferase system HPr-like phosphotransfer protein
LFVKYIVTLCKKFNMATITIKINEKSKEGKTLMELIKLFSVKKTVVEIINIPNDGIDESIQDYKEGNIIQAKNAQELLKKIKA